MTISETLLEGKRIPVSAQSRVGRFDTVVVETTIFRDLKAMVDGAAQADAVRGILSNGRLYIWPAWDALHVQIADELALEAPRFFWLVKEGTDPFPEGADWDVSDDNPVRDGVRLVPGRGVLEHELIQRIFSN